MTIESGFGDPYPIFTLINPKGIVTDYAKGGHEDKYMEIDTALSKKLSK